MKGCDSVFFYRILFRARNNGTDHSQYRWDIYWYCGCLYKNGNILKDYRIVQKENGYDVYVTLVGACPPQKGRESNRYIDECFEKINKLCTVEWEDLGAADDCEEVCSCAASSCYLMDTDASGEDRLIVCGDCGKTVPLNKLPYLGEYEQEHLALLGWQNAYMAVDSLYVESIVDRFAVDQLSNPNSQLSRLGRGLCKELEEKTGIPTYYHLMSSKRKQSVCMVCKKPWQEGKSGRDFFCDRCRLVIDE